MRFRLILLLTLAAMGFGLIETSASVPPHMNVQGRLTDSTSAPLAVDSALFAFRIHDSEFGGSQIWPAVGAEIQTIAIDSDGLWTANVGAVDGLSPIVFADTARWLEIGIDDGVNPPTLLPRVVLNTGPYAFRAASAQKADTALAIVGGGGGPFLPLAGGTMAGAIASTGDPEITMGKANLGSGNSNSGVQAFVAGLNNAANGDHAVVSGGRNNRANNGRSTVAGGEENNASGAGSFIGGGQFNRAEGALSFVGGGDRDTADGSSSVVVGGQHNVAKQSYSAVLGGLENTVNGLAATLVGGRENSATADYAFVGGGGGNDPGDGNTASGFQSVVGGGTGNAAGDTAATIGGGNNNTASGVSSAVIGGSDNVASGASSIVGGGRGNTATQLSTTVSGGTSNSANAIMSTVGGGNNNTASGARSVVGGGARNYARGLFSVVAGGGGQALEDSNSASGDNSAIGGGHGNVASGLSSTISGGIQNFATNNNSVVGGGTNNGSSGAFGTISGGQLNSATADGAAVGGGDVNVASAQRATIAGGRENGASGEYATVGGGWLNIATKPSATISGGNDNDANAAYATIGGGLRNLVSDTGATVNGGRDNEASGKFASIPGGELNTAAGTFSLAAGRRAKADHNGCFVWGDNTNLDFASTGVKQFLIRASGGVGIGTNDPLAQIHVNTSFSDVALHMSGSSRDITWPVGERLQFGEWDDTTFTEHVRIDQEGDVGIGLGGSDASNVLTLPNNANVTGRGLANAWSIYSSRRWKDNIRPIEDASTLVQRLQGVRYRWSKDGTDDIGLIAEDVGKVIPEVVTYEDNGVDAMSVDYARLVAVLVEAVKEQQKTIDQLSDRVQSLEKEL